MLIKTHAQQFDLKACQASISLPRFDTWISFHTPMGIDMSPCTEGGAASAGDAPPALVEQVWAMFVEERTVVVDGIDPSWLLVEKRVWLLDGNFTQAELDSWAADVAKGRRTNLDALIHIQTVDSVAWPALNEYLGVGLGLVTRQAFNAICIALLEAGFGRPECANSIMDDFRLQTGVQTLP